MFELPDIKYSLIENSLLEWRGKVSAVVVFDGCNLRCSFCHSWRYVYGTNKDLLFGIDSLISLLDRQRDWLDGVVFTGGEATLNKDLVASIKMVKLAGFKTKLHTNGTNPNIVETLIESNLLDCLSLDYKYLFNKTLLDVIGATNINVLISIWKSFDIIKNSTIDREYHTTIVPNFIDKLVFIEMAKSLEENGTWYIQQFNNRDCLDKKLMTVQPYSLTVLREFEHIAKKYHRDVVLTGV